MDWRRLIEVIAHSRDLKGDSEPILADTEIHSPFTEAQRQHAHGIGCGAGLVLVAFDSGHGGGDLFLRVLRILQLKAKRPIRWWT